MKALNNKELEFKYAADEIPFIQFKAWADSLNPTRSIYVCGYDHFFSNRKDQETFIRHRVGDNFNQFTLKRKLVEQNNFLRDEINIALGKDVTEATARALAEGLGYEFNRTIFKTVFVYDYDKFVLSYYSVTDTNLKEIGRFIEIEMAEDGDWKSEDEAWSTLKALEKQAVTALGISPQGRIKKSLFEQFRRF